jgi:hypothetical protein
VRCREAAGIAFVEVRLAVPNDVGSAFDDELASRLFARRCCCPPECQLCEMIANSFAQLLIGSVA